LTVVLLPAPVTVTVGQWLTITATVSNTGEATAEGVTLTVAPGISPAGALVLQGSAGVTNTALAGHASKVFSYLYTAGLSGTAAVTASAAGTDHNSGNAVLSGVGSTSVLVQTAPLLTGSLVAAPGSVLAGGLFTVTLTVSNSGQATAVNVSPVAALWISDAAVGQLDTPTASVTITAGGSYSWSWTVTTTATANNVSFSASVLGTGLNQGTSLGQLDVSSNQVFVVDQNPLLTASYVKVSPSPMTQGQVVTAVLRVKNNNTIVSASNVQVSAVALQPTTFTGSLIGGVPPVLGTLGAGASADFTFLYKVDVAGTLSLSATAQASAGSPTVQVSNPLTVQSSVSLTAKGLTMTPAVVSVGQAFTLRVTLSNNGTGVATAVSVVPTSLIKNGTAGTPVLTLVGPASAVLGANGSQEFTYTGVAAAGTGSGPWGLAYNAQGTGYDANHGTVVTTSAYGASGSISVQKPAVLTAGLTLGASLVNVGQTFAVTMTVQNTGGTDAVLTAPSTLTLVGSPVLLQVSGPVPTTVTVQAGNSATFWWSYQAVGSGVVALQGSASGQDQNSGSVVSSGVATSANLTVQAPAVLNITSVQATPATVGTGGTITVLLTVNNSGDATASQVSATSLVATDAAAVPTTGTVQPVTATLAGGATQVFTYLVSASGSLTYSADVSFTAGVLGQDANTMASVSATSGLTNAVTVIPRASLNVKNLAFLDAGYLPVSQLTVGQVFVLVATVSNEGQGTANAVTPVSAPVLFGNGLAVKYGTVTPAAATLPTNASQVFTYTYTATGAGQIGFSATATGYNSGDNLFLNSATGTTGSLLTIQGPAE
jgi:hypothetical protein